MSDGPKARAAIYPFKLLQILDNAVRQSCEKAQLVSRKSTPAGEYLEYEVPGLFGKDFME